MSTNQPVEPAFSGPVPLIGDGLPVMYIDVVGLTEIRLPRTSSLWRTEYAEEAVSEYGLLDGTVMGWQPLSLSLPEGPYLIRPVAGGIEHAPIVTTDSQQGLWNLSLVTPFTGGAPRENAALGPFIRSGASIIRLGGPSFREDGFASQVAAAATYKDFALPFYHAGGPLDIRLDQPEPGQGSILFEVTALATLQGSGRWMHVQSAGPVPTLVDDTAAFPTLTGLAPGQHLYEFEVVADGARYVQRVVISVWAAIPGQGRGAYFAGDAPALVEFSGENRHDPARPVIFPAKPGPVVEVSSVRQPPRYTGQLSGLPVDPHAWRRPRPH